MATDQPLVSIVVPAYNAERHLMETVRSVRSQIHTHLEIIIVDDGSTDGTRELAMQCSADDSRIQVVTQPNAGPSSARNTGAKIANGQYLCFLDSDDTLHPAKISRQVAELKRTGAGVVYCDYFTADEELVPLAICETRPKMPDIGDQLPLQNVFPPHSALVRRDVFDLVGPFDEGLLRAEDWDYWIRCAEATSMVYLPGALCSYRRHESQLHNDRWKMRSNQLLVTKKNYSAGSSRRRMALAGMHMGDAKYSHAQGRRLRMLYHLVKVVLLARSPSRTLQVIRISGYG